MYFEPLQTEWFACRSPVSDCDSKAGDRTTSSEEENLRTEKRKKYQQPIHVSSAKTMASECAQQ